MCGLPVSVKFRHFEVETVPTPLLTMQQNLVNPFMSSLVKLILLLDMVLNVLGVCCVCGARFVMSVVPDGVTFSQLMVDWG